MSEIIHEKSCGAVVYTLENGQPRYLVLRFRHNGDYGFPKGHMEPGETERETALRELWEETSLRVRLREDCRQEVCYTMPNGRRKTVVFFLGEFTGQSPAHCPGFEESEYHILPYAEAWALLTHDTSRQILRGAHRALTGEGQ